MKQDTKDLILKESFKLFAWKRYEQVTVSDLERVTKLTRGAIFYYMKNKEHLFIEVLDKYVLNKNARLDISTSGSLSAFIDAFLEQVKDMKKHMNSLGVKNANFAYANIVNQAIYYYPDFAKIAKDKEDEEKGMWKNAVQRAIESGEIVNTVDSGLVANIFQQTYNGFTNKGIILPEGIDLDETQTTFMEIYRLIKK